MTACAATLTIWNPDPRLEWGCEAAMFAIAASLSFRSQFGLNGIGAILACISLWGLGQIVFGSTVYRWATINAILQVLAMAATALASFLALPSASIRRRIFRATVWFGFLVSLISVLAYFSSYGKILWIFRSVYPDNWGPFSSRNNFAQFLELCFPISIYLMGKSEWRWFSSIPPAVILAAGFASASRAGGILLTLELLVTFIFLWSHLTGRFIAFALTATSCIVLVGAGVLWRRLADPDPFKYRREISRSAAAMMSVHPWRGYGLGTFSTVYPEFAEFDTGATVEHAHNDWLEWAAGGGVPFAILWAALAVSLAPAAIRSIWGLGVIAVFLHALVDYPFARFGVTAWTFLIIGAIVREKTAREHPLLKRN